MQFNERNRARGKFASWLATLTVREDRATLAALRAGRIGGRTTPRFWSVVLPHLPEELGTSEQAAWFAVASLVGNGLVPAAPDPNAKRWQRNLGAVIRQALGNDRVNEPAMVARLEALLASPEQATAIERIRWLAPLLRDEPVDLWILIDDLAAWDDESGRTQEAWARGIWTDSGPSENEV